jgi:membrane-associated HD superfamily phosphohydrolase
LGVSLYLTVLALRHRKYFWLWMPLSVILGIAQIFMIEYFVGLELIRPVIIWAVLWAEEKEKKRRVLWKTLLYWSPFILGLVIYFWYRVFYFPTTLATTDPNNPVLLKAILSAPLATLSMLAKTVYQDIGYLIISVWANAFSPDLIHSHSKVMWLSWFVGIVTAILFCFYIYRTSRDKKAAENSSFFYMLVVGGIALLGGAVPVWAAGRQINDGNWSDRFTLAPLVGAVILVVSLVDWLFRTKNQKQWLLAILVASSISYQIYNSN